MSVGALVEDDLGAETARALRVVAKPLVVLKFGSSVLVAPDDLPELVSEIYGHVRAGASVVAVVSAFAGETDRLLTLTERLGCGHDNVNAPSVVALGEETTAALAALACDRAGLSAIALKTAEVGLRAEGGIFNADPVALDDTRLRQALALYDVVVVPGFVAVDAVGRTLLLGRGGTDLSAVFLGHHLRAATIKLLKDVDGVYETDPATTPNARRFGRIDWSEARAVAGKLIQTRALDFAERHQLTLSVGAIGEKHATLVGPAAAAPRPRARPLKLKVALGGYGVVGAGVAERLLARPDAFEIVSVLVRDLKRARPGDLAPALFTSDQRAALERADVVIDALSEASAGAAWSELALQNGVHVVSANKQALVGRLWRLREAAARTGAVLSFSAAVGGAAPILETVARAQAQSRGIARIEGVLNGTVNFVLGLLSEGFSLEAALARARAAGLAEEDPSADLDGLDAAAKLRLIAQSAFGVDLPEPDLVIAKMRGGVVERAQATPLKQVARLWFEDMSLRGSISFEPAGETRFSALGADRNAIAIESVDGALWTASGRGAGRWPTTESVFADLLELREMLS